MGLEAWGLHGWHPALETLGQELRGSKCEGRWEGVWGKGIRSAHTGLLGKFSTDFGHWLTLEGQHQRGTGCPSTNKAPDVQALEYRT